MDDVTLTDDDIRTEFGTETKEWVSADADADDADTNTDTDSDDADQDADADDPS